MTAKKDLLLLHSSDLHVDDSYTMRTHDGDGNRGLAAVLATAKAVKADVVLLVGDVFEHNRLARDILDRTSELVAACPAQVVFLPGNHDPVSDDSVFRRAEFPKFDHVHVLGMRHELSVTFSDLDLEIWGRAHLDYNDMAPLENPKSRSVRWHVGAAHGHFIPKTERTPPPRPAWLFDETEIEATAVDYLALGHWNQPIRVGTAKVPAYYSGSPEYANTVNLVRFTAAGQVLIEREPIRWNEAD